MVVAAIIALLVLANGVFVAAEFAIVAMPAMRASEFSLSKNPVERRVARILRDPRLIDRYIATAQLGISAASLALGMYGEQKIATELSAYLEGSSLPAWLTSHAVASVIAVLALTYFHIVLGEMVPKAVALLRTERAVLIVTPMIEACQLVAYPLILALNSLGNGLLSLVGITRARHGQEHFLSPQELKYIVRESGESGLLRTESASVLEQLIGFGRLTAGQVMVPRVKIIGIELGASVDEIVEVLRTSPHTRYPVYARDLDHILGAVHIKELLPCLQRGRGIAGCDVRAIPFVPETSTLNTVLSLMREKRAQIVAVMDEHGGTAGILTYEDLFSEVFGEIDESTASRQPPIEDHGSELEVTGTVRVESVGEHLGRTIRRDDVDSVSGLVLALLERPPGVGDVVELDGVRFEVLEVEGHGVRKCRVTQLERPGEDEDDTLV